MRHVPDHVVEALAPVAGPEAWRLSAPIEAWLYLADTRCHPAATYILDTISVDVEMWNVPSRYDPATNFEDLVKAGRALSFEVTENFCDQLKELFTMFAGWYDFRRAQGHSVFGQVGSSPPMHDWESLARLPASWKIPDLVDLPVDLVRMSHLRATIYERLVSTLSPEPPLLDGVDGVRSLLFGLDVAAVIEDGSAETSFGKSVALDFQYYQPLRRLEKKWHSGSKIGGAGVKTSPRIAIDGLPNFGEWLYYFADSARRLSLAHPDGTARYLDQ